jgi:hypothetical protein
MKKSVLISAIFLILAGCTMYEVEEPGGSKYYMSLEEALKHVREPDSYDIDGFNLYLTDLEHLWRQSHGRDKIILEKKNVVRFAERS